MTTDLKMTTRRLTLPSAQEVAAMAPEDLYPVPSAARFVEDDYLEATDLEAMADLLIEVVPPEDAAGPAYLADRLCAECREAQP